MKHTLKEIVNHSDVEEHIQKSRQINDGDIVEWPLLGTTTIVCCDCGLTHHYDISVDIENNILNVAVFRSDEFPQRFPLWTNLKRLLLHAL